MNVEYFSFCWFFKVIADNKNRDIKARIPFSEDTGKPVTGTDFNRFSEIE